MSVKTSWQSEEPSERSALIDLSAVRRNVVRLTQLARGRKLIAVVKADGYGHGAVEVARTALSAGADMLGTAHVSEALALRQAGITASVLSWLHTPSTDFLAALQHNVSLGISGWELDGVLTAARRTGKVATLHLKIDTGLGRNGATASQWPELVERVVAAQNDGLVHVEGIFTHLAVADEPARVHETTEQLNALTEAVRIAREAGLKPAMIHAANTPGLLSADQCEDPDDILRDAVRVGLGIYGLSPFDDRTPLEFGLIPAMTLRTCVANVKAVPAGHGVSYGLTYHTEVPTHLALIPLGYADGVPRVATGAPVYIGGRVYPVVGRIAMDQCVIDLAHGKSVTTEVIPARSEKVEETVDPLVHIGDEAVLFGAGDYPSAAEWADAAGSINYEIVTRVSPRVPREYTGHSHPNSAVVAESSSAHDVAAHGLPLDGQPTRDSSGDSHPQPHWTLTRHPASAEETQLIAEKLAAHLEAGDLLLLNGELGAGKTTFTQGLGAGLGVREGIISPTFVLSRQHPNLPEGTNPGGPDLVHVDAYRLDTSADIDNIDLEDTVASSVTVVEWGTGKVEHLSESRLVIDIVRPRGAVGAGSEKTPSATTESTDHQDLTVALEALNDEWNEDGQGLDEPRTIVMRGYGPRWIERLDL